MRRRTREDVNLPLMEHIMALRKVLVISAYAIAIGTVIGWFVSDPAFAYLASPVTRLKNITFITTTPMEPILVKLKLSMGIGVILALPVIMWQIWSFVLPALKQNERKYLYMIVPSSVFLFLSGAALCFYLVMPIGVKFLLYVGAGGMLSTPFVTKTSYLTFIFTFLVSFGIVFQLPIVLLILIRIGVLSPKTLAKKRRWAILIIIIVVAIVSPSPDLLTQVLMAVPMYMLFEVSIWFGYLVVRSREKQLTASKGEV